MTGSRPSTPDIPRAGDEPALTDPARLVVGGDVGGTGTRVVVAGLDGRVLGRGQAAGGNPTTHGVAAATAAMGAALGQALAGLDPSRVVAATFGMAGGGALRDPAVADAYAQLFAAAGVTAVPHLTGDALVAFCSATPAADGVIVLAGTGAAVAAVRGHDLARTVDGLGWLLGDAGSGFWLGREAVRRTIDALIGTGPDGGRLAHDVVARLVPDPPDDRVLLRDDLIRAVNSAPPVALSTLAPLVTAAVQDDPVAAAICRDAAGELFASVLAVADLVDADVPVVLNGGVVRDPSSPVGASLRRLLAERFTGPVLVPADGTLGAAWLAVRAVLGADSPGLAEVHATLLG